MNAILAWIGVWAGACCAAERPNIVLMLSDDQAWNGLSVPMHPDFSWSKSSIVETPNLERLAAQGMRFSAAYAPASVCSPTRVSLQTGKSPAAMRWTKAARPETGRMLIEPRSIRSLPDSEVTIAELLGGAGYATAHYGKWHLNGGGPEAHGYDAGDGAIGNEYAHQFSDPNPADIFGMADRAIEFMKACRNDNQPFFVQLSWHALHAPQNAMRTTLDKYARKLGANAQEKRVGSAAIAENLDTGVGVVVDAIDKLGLKDNTYVIYMSDNGSGGGGGRNGGGRNRADRLSGGKGSVWEGGIRSPMIVRGPGVPANSWCHHRVVGYDWFPTFCHWAEIDKSQLPVGIEGGSLHDLLDDGEGQVQRVRDELVFHFPHYQSGDGPHTALILDDYKLMKFYEDERLALFHLADDITESTDLAEKLPEKAADLNLRLIRYLRDVDAAMPVSNSRYVPGEAAPRSGRPRGGRTRRPSPPRRPRR